MASFVNDVIDAPRDIHKKIFPRMFSKHNRNKQKRDIVSKQCKKLFCRKLRKNNPSSCQRNKIISASLDAFCDSEVCVRTPALCCRFDLPEHQHFTSTERLFKLNECIMFSFQCQSKDYKFVFKANKVEQEAKAPSESSTDNPMEHEEAFITKTTAEKVVDVFMRRKKFQPKTII
jgi:hypothetical protein